MSGVWSRIRSGFTPSDGTLAKLKQSASRPDMGTGRAPAPSPPSSAPSSDPSPRVAASTPWESMGLQKRGSVPPEPGKIWMQSPFFRGSTMKLNMLARQIIGLPLDAAMLQMQFSPKKPAKIVMQLLSHLKVTIQRHRDNPALYYIKEAPVGRGTYLKRLDIKGRGRFGMHWRGHAFIRICCHKPDPVALARKMLKIKKIPREDKPVLKKLDYF